MKIYLAILLCSFTAASYGQQQKMTKEQKKQEHKQRMYQLMKQEEEGAMIFSKQGAFGIKLNTDGYGIFYEHGKYKTINKTNLWWLEAGEHRHPKEERTIVTTGGGFFQVGNPYIFGKINNFYNLKLGIGQQRLIGGKGNKNGVAVSAIYGGGIAGGFLKPYFLSIQDVTTGQRRDIKYDASTDSLFRDPSIIYGSAGFTKGFGDMSFVPGVHARLALRFDYGRYNELLSAIETGINAEYYTKNMQIMLDNTGKKFFFNAYVAIAFGKRK